MFGLDEDYFKQFKDKVNRVFDDFKHRPTVLPSKIEIPSNHIFITNRQTLQLEPVQATPFEVDKDYFEVTVNQLYLKNQSQLWVQTSPTVVANTQFAYADKPDICVPCLVGPTAIQKKIGETKVPVGGRMLIENTRVAGYYPYKGSQLRSTIILCQLNDSDIAKKIMKIIEAVAGAIDYSTQLSAYLKVAGVIVDGIEELKGLQEGLNPVIGYDGPFESPCCIALINKQTENKDELWVIDGKLKKGLTLEQALKDSSQFAEADYALISISKTQARNDIRFLSFYPAFEKIMEDASKKDKASWERATTDLSTLFMTMLKSPDLTEMQAEAQYDSWFEKIKKLHEKLGTKRSEGMEARVDVTEEEKAIMERITKTPQTAKDRELLAKSLKALDLFRG